MKGRILLTATASGSGKTMLTMGLIAAIKKRNIEVSGFKCGPDYIDPMFHRKALGIQSSNLDPYFSSDEYLQKKVMSANGISIIEGVMGYYDGIGVEGKCSTYDVARITKTPVILIVNPKGMYTSVGALIQGFVKYKDDSKIAGVIFNNTNKMMYKGLSIIAGNAGVKPLGYVEHIEDAAIESRHLGLVTADEMDDINDRIDKISDSISATVDIDGILEIAYGAEALCIKPDNFSTRTKNVSEDIVTIAVARDEAFSFIYDDNIIALENAGFTIEYFSPIHDKSVPQASALYIPGGYPELYLTELNINKSMRESIKDAVEDGIPTIAECGGFMYLGNAIEDVDMVGVIDMKSYKKDKLQRFGYGEMISEKDTLILDKGQRVRVHEFHYFDSTFNGEDYVIEKASNNTKYMAAIANENMYAGYPHLYISGTDIADRLYKKSLAYKEKRKNA